MEEANGDRQYNPHMLLVLEALKKAFNDLPTDTIFIKQDFETAIKAVSELSTHAEVIISRDPTLYKLSQLLRNLKTLADQFPHSSQAYSLSSFVQRNLLYYQISIVARSIETEIQKWIDRESVRRLVKILEQRGDEDAKVRALKDFETWVSKGFDRDSQDLILKSKIFPILESVVCDSTCSKRIREHAALAITAVVRFNTAVFAGLVLMGPTIGALISMSSSRSIQVLCALTRLIRSPLVDVISSNGEIPKIIGFLSSEEESVRVAAMECVLEIGYFGRKEAIEAMLEEGLIEKLVELQRRESGGRCGEIEREGESRRREEEEEEEEEEESERPFASCVAKWAVQVEMGEGLGQREREAFKLDILGRVKAAGVSDAEAATIAAEVLWGSSP